MPFFVQFPHAGPEHTPKPSTVGTVMGWNTGDHMRKFLRAEGAYVLDGQRHTGAYAFWGEWEAPSRVLEVWPKQDQRPRFLHEPIFRAPPAGNYQNTDPLVYGDRFLYTNCRQLRHKKLRSLTSGSIVLFGSKRGGGFVLDTVFVVGDAQPASYQQGETGVLPDHPIADAAVFNPLATTNDVGKSCVAYSARMHDDGPDAPYSFVPCRPQYEGWRFARPVLEPLGELADLINPNLAMSVRMRELSHERLAAVWAHVAGVCQQQGLAQGVHAMPPRVSQPQPSTGRRS